MGIHQISLITRTLSEITLRSRPLTVFTAVMTVSGSKVVDNTQYPLEKEKEKERNDP
jgi:hypothetical protein